MDQQICATIEYIDNKNGLQALSYTLAHTYVENSVTRFVEILPLWQNFKSLWGTFWMGYLAFGKLLYQLWNFYATGQIVIVVNSQRLNTNSVIWSHWWRSQKIRKEILAEFSFWLVKENCVTVQWHGAKAQTQETLFTFHL